MMTTGFPTAERSILVWNFLACKHVKASFAGHDYDLKADNGLIKIKLDIAKDPKADQFNVTIETREASKPPVTTKLNIGGIPASADGKPVNAGDVLTAAVTKEQPAKPGEVIVLGKGALAFPSLTAEVLKD
jgi:hypothetical protein